MGTYIAYGVEIAAYIEDHDGNITNLDKHAFAWRYLFDASQAVILVLALIHDVWLAHLFFFIQVNRLADTVNTRFQHLEREQRAF